MLFVYFFLVAFLGGFASALTSIVYDNLRLRRIYRKHKKAYLESQKNKDSRVGQVIH